MNDTNKERPTPRTDTITKEIRADSSIFQSQEIYHMADFARTLERELAEAREAEASETRWAAQYKRERDEAREQRDGLAGALGHLRDKCDESDDAYYGTLSTHFVRLVASQALATVKGGSDE